MKFAMVEDVVVQSHTLNKLNNSQRKPSALGGSVFNMMDA